MEREVTGVYSNTQIKQGIKDGNIVMYPYNEKQINGSSIDVRLGEWFIKTRDPNQLSHPMIDPYDEESIEQYFDGPFKAKPLSYVREKMGFEVLPKRKPHELAIVLQPKQRILGHTQEYIGIKQGTSSMQARSSLGRLGVSVCLDAGWGDPGYVNRWTMEIANNNPDRPIALIVGTRVAQLVLFHTGFVASEYSELSGHYQSMNADNLQQIVASWEASKAMKPKELTVD